MLKSKSMSHVLTEVATQVGSSAPPRELSRIYQEHVQYVWRSLRHLGVHPSDLEDVCQDVFIVVGRKLASFEQRSSLRTWIYGICLRTASDYRGRAFRRREILHEEPPEEGRCPAQEATASQREVRDRLVELLDELVEEQREVFVLYELEELTMREVAEVLDCPLQTAYSRLHAARRTLKEQLLAGGLSP